MRKNSLLLVAMVFTVSLAGSLWGDALFEVERTTLHVNSIGNVLILSMDNLDEEVGAIRLDIAFDTACFKVTGLDRTARSTDMDIVNFADNTGILQIAIGGLDGCSIAPGTGAIAEITVDVGDCAEGDYLWDVSGIAVADPQGNYVYRDAVDNFITVTTSNRVIGDLNEDGSINVVDVLAVVNHILGIEPLEGNALLCADCSGDEEINIIDALGIVNVILEIGECSK
jgi:hypothetical protein